MKPEVNAGYTITDRLAVGDSEFVIGQREEAPAQFVTWKCSNGEKNYFWGHYLGNRLSAIEDLCHRAIDEVAYLRAFQQQQPPNKQPERQTRKHSEPMR